MILTNIMFGVSSVGKRKIVHIEFPCLLAGTGSVGIELCVINVAEGGCHHQAVLFVWERHLNYHLGFEVGDLEAAEAVIVVEVGDQVAHEVQFAFGVLPLNLGCT